MPHVENHEFEPQIHEAFWIGTIIYGTERTRYHGSYYVASTDVMVFMNPEEGYTGRTAAEHGWRYPMCYIEPATFENISGMLSFQEVLLHDTRPVRAISTRRIPIWQSDATLTFDWLLQSLISQIQSKVGRYYVRPLISNEVMQQPKH